MPRYKLVYFDAMGRAEVTRLIFAQAGVEYEDYRIKGQEEWLKLKPETPLGQVPVLYVDDVAIGHSQAINRYLARSFGLVSEDNLEAAKCDMLVSGLEDLENHFIPWFQEPDPEKKKQLWDRLNNTQLQPFLDRYETVLEKSTSGYFVGDKLTWTDLVLFSMLSYWNEKMPHVLDRHQRIGDFLARVAELPNIKLWMERRPKTLW